MSEEKEFPLKSIVWASTQQYPPWPAKIVRKLHHKGKTVYKVHFFAHPTFSYLHSTSLAPFHTTVHTQSPSIEQNITFLKALELAKFSVSKQQHLTGSGDRQVGFRVVSKSNLGLGLEENGIVSKEEMDVPQKITQLSRKITPQTTTHPLVFDQILPQNVLQLLDSYQKGQIAQRLGNLKRKQIISFQNHLKQNLLLKYKLHAVDFFKPPHTPNHTNICPLKELRTNKLIKKKNQLSQFDEKQKCARKIQKILFQKGMQRHLTYSTTLKIMNELEKRASDIPYPSNLLQIREESVKLIQQICSNIQQIQQMEVTYIEKHILSFLDVEFHQHKLEEGSRMTQIYEEFVV